MTRPMLTVIVIGRNEAEHLRRSFAAINNIPISYELIYVDSASTDDSGIIASRAGARVIELQNSDYLCAAAGRYVGTLVSHSEWILYLDGDMELAAGFAKKIPDLMSQSSSATSVGYVGWYENLYPDGTTRWNLLRQSSKYFSAVTFGGALLIKREPVVQAGSWDYRVASYEELDLHTRLKRNGSQIAFVPERMITHYTLRLNPFRVLLQMFVPFGKGTRRTCGIGQLLRSRFARRSLISFLWYSPRPFVFLALLFLSVGVGLVSLCWARLILLLIPIGIGCAGVTKRLSSAVVYLSFPLRIIVGWKQYRRHWVPRYRLIDNWSEGTIRTKHEDVPGRSCSRKRPMWPVRKKGDSS